MTDLTIQCFALDSTDPDRAATFWQEALGWRRTHDTPDEVALEPPEHSLEDGVVPDLLFLRVSDERAGKNRLHLDLRPDAEPGQAAEVARLENLGATLADVGQTGEEGWVVMEDPEGNVFCVLKPLTPAQLADVEAIRAARKPAN